MKHTIFTPYRVCPLGAHVDHQLGQVTGFAIDRGVKLEFDITEDGTFDLISKNYPGHIMFTLEDELEREMLWGDFLKAAIVALSRKYELRRGIKGVIEGTLPVGGLSSSAAVILTYLNAVCIANDIQITRPEIISNAIWAERNYIGVNVGKLDQSCEVYCRKNGLLFLDTLDDSNEIIPVSSNMNPFEIMIVFGGKERQLAGSAYNTRVDECKAAAYHADPHARKSGPLLLHRQRRESLRPRQQLDPDGCPPQPRHTVARPHIRPGYRPELQHDPLLGRQRLRRYPLLRTLR